jgi:hypothetical protein
MLNTKLLYISPAPTLLRLYILLGICVRVELHQEMDAPEAENGGSLSLSPLLSGPCATSPHITTLPSPSYPPPSRSLSLNTLFLSYWSLRSTIRYILAPLESCNCRTTQSVLNSAPLNLPIIRVPCCIRC